MPKPKFLSKEMVLNAMARTRSNRAAARYLHVSFNHYKKFAKTYTDDVSGESLFELHKNQSGSGIPKFLSNRGKEPPLLEILEGRVPHYHFTPERIKQRIIAEGLIEERCNKCGFNEQRVLDFKAPLIMNYRDKNKENLSLSNLEFLCYNCYFLYIGNVFTEKEIIALEDYNDSINGKEPDWELDEHMKDHLESLGLIDTNYISGSEYISYL